MRLSVAIILWISVMIAINAALAERDTKSFERYCENHGVYCESVE